MSPQKSTLRARAAAKTARAETKRDDLWYHTYNYLKWEDATYEDALLISMIDGKDHERVSEDALMLCSVVSSMTPALRKLTYNYGIAAGRALYAIMARRGRYSWQGDSIPDLISFLEKAGYRHVYYKILPSSIEVRIVKSSRAEMGSNIHQFEAGLISGFLSAGNGNYVRVREVSCCNNGGEYCSFMTGQGPEEGEQHKVAELNRFISYASSAPQERERNMLVEYQMISSTPLMNREYSDSIRIMLSYAGAAISEAYTSGKVTKAAMERLTTITHMLGLGIVDYKLKPLKVEVMFNDARAKKEFVDISISFLNGMIGGYFSGALKPRLSSGRGGSYKITMRQ